MEENTVPVEKKLSEKEERRRNDASLAKMKKQNPGIKITKRKGGGVTITNPKSPSPLLSNLLKRAKE